jgi:hypothetical protein
MAVAHGVNNGRSAIFANTNRRDDTVVVTATQWIFDTTTGRRNELVLPN